MANQNTFENVVDEVQAAPRQQRTQRLIEGIAKQMQASNNPQTQQLGQELRQVEARLNQACQQN